VIAFFVFISAGNEYRYVQMQEAARRHGFGGWPWPPSDDGPSTGSDEDKVIISPPPYEDGPDRETDIHPNDEDDPSRNVFRR